MAALAYRPEIDGLRAVAVVPVILFHAGFEVFSGGYVGVDVFFVVSGYLITSIIISEQQAGQFTLAGFYERRARRILPALMAMMIVSFCLAWFWLLPSEMLRFCKVLFATTLFASNIYFARGSDYFDPTEDNNPLLHTWSLAVEEQFYVIFPLILLACARSRQKASLIIVVFSLTSLLIAQLGSSPMLRAMLPPGLDKLLPAGAAGFYLTTGRIWELGLGCLAALHLSGNRFRRMTNEVGSMAGVALIAISIFIFDSSTPFPGFLTLLPTLGTLLIILCANPSNTTGRALASPLLVGIGLVSYSAYLWHQPVFAFTRVRLSEEPSVQVYILLMFVTAVMAYVSWRFIERPFRNRQRFSRTAIFAWATLIAIIVGSAGLLGIQQHGISNRLPSNVQALLHYSDSNWGVITKCITTQWKYIPPEESCSFGPDPIRVALLGDSHASSLAPQLRSELEAQGIGLQVLIFNGCPPIEDVNIVDFRDTKYCDAYYRDVIDFLATHPTITHIVLVARWSFYYTGEPFDNGEGGLEPDDGIVAVPAKGRALNEIQRRQHYINSIRTTVDTYLQLDKHLVITYPIPEAGWNVPEYLARRLWFDEVEYNFLGTEYSQFQSRNDHIYRALDSLGEDQRIARIYPEHSLCNSDRTDRCTILRKGIPLYFDDDHVNMHGALAIAQQIAHAVSEN